MTTPPSRPVWTEHTRGVRADPAGGMSGRGYTLMTMSTVLPEPYHGPGEYFTHWSPAFGNHSRYTIHHITCRAVDYGPSSSPRPLLTMNIVVQMLATQEYFTLEPIPAPAAGLPVPDPATQPGKYACSVCCGDLGTRASGYHAAGFTVSEIMAAEAETGAHRPLQTLAALAAPC